MSERNTAGDYPAYRAPVENERGLITTMQATGVREQMLARLRAHEPEHVTVPEQPLLYGMRLEAVRAQARCEAVQLAVRFTSRYRSVGDLGFCRGSGFEGGRRTKPIVLTGHQPELYHAGVWFKNFLTSRLADELGGIALNFLVDNDVCRSTAIRVPCRLADGTVVAQSIPFDEQRVGVPWELRQPASRSTWESFPRRVLESLRLRAGEPLLNEMWPLATAALEETNRLGLAISQGRHQLERRLGLRTMEVPLSWLTETESFARFSLALIGDLLEFQRIYNSQLDRYREAHQIRNRAHPVPPLERRQEWMEAPLWIYHKSHATRQRLWVSYRGTDIILADRAGWQACLEGGLRGESGVQQWRELQATDGICLRPRALLTTMFTRLCISDLFIHGIGGGKYDQLTDRIIAEFFRIPPPPIIVASATLRLPLGEEWVPAGTSSDTEQRIQEYRQRIWRAKFHGDTLVPEASLVPEDLSSEVARLQGEKRSLLANIPPRGHKWEWHHAMTAVNKRLAELAEPQMQQARQAVEELTGVERQQRLLESREFSFALFPREYIADVLNRLSKT
jgi:hypothetical protein